MVRKYAYSQLWLVLVPVAFMVAAMVAALWLPREAWPRWGVTAGTLLMAAGWAVWQARVSRYRRAGQA